jgi:glycine dehydrogenase
MACSIMKSPGGMGADIAVGSAQRFGLPMGFGGPHPGYMACKEKFMRKMPGRIIGISNDKDGNKALRMAM